VLRNCSSLTPRGAGSAWKDPLRGLRLRTDPSARPLAASRRARAYVDHVIFEFVAFVKSSPVTRTSSSKLERLPACVLGSLNIGTLPTRTSPRRIEAVPWSRSMSRQASPRASDLPHGRRAVSGTPCSNGRRHSVRHDGFTTAGPSPRPSRTRHPRPSGPPRVDQQLPELSGRDAQYSPIRSARSRSRRYTVAGDRPSLSKTHAAGSRSTRSRMRRTDFVVFKRTTGWPLSAQVLMKQ